MRRLANTARRLALQPFVSAALAWLGLSTAGFTFLLAIEFLLRVGSSDIGAAIIYLPAVALENTVRFSLGVGCFHVGLYGLHRLRLRRWPWAAAGLLGVALPAIHALAGTLVAGAWIAEQHHLRAIQASIVVILESAWLALWLWHAFGALSGNAKSLAAPAHRLLRPVEEAVYWLAGGLALPCLFVLYGGLLRPYSALAERLLFPTWLIASSIAYRAWDRPRGSLLRMLPVLALLAAASAWAWRVAAPSNVASVRAEALLAGGWLGLSEERLTFGLSWKPPAFDFRRASAQPCPGPRRYPSHGLTPTQVRNVIFLSIDTMRRDVIGKRALGRAVTPNLNALASDAVFFERAVAPAPITLYSLGAMVTGHSVSQLLWLSSVPENIFHRTRAMFDVQQLVLPKWSDFTGHAMGRLLRQGTPTTFVPRSKDAAEPLIAALRAARAQGQRGFFWLHLVDAHYPYSTHKGFDFGREPIDRYHSEVAFDDAALGRVLDVLRAEGYFEDSLIVVFADHGESVGEGGYYGHGISVVSRFTDIPLIVRYPGVRPRRSLAAVTLTDVAPTVLHFLDQAIPGSLGGCSLLLAEKALTSCPPAVSVVYGIGAGPFGTVLRMPVRSLYDMNRRATEITRWRRFNPDLALATADYRYVVNLSTGLEHLFKRNGAPFEGHDFVPDDLQRVAVMRRRLAQWTRDEARRIVCK
jgi:arylsulfatase A-like enzyme